MSAAEDSLEWQLRALYPGYQREHRFAPPRRWRFDFAWPREMIAVEVEGGTWTFGRHTRGQGYEKDLEKYNEAALAGWLVIRVTPGQIESGQAIGWIERAWLPTPTSSLPSSSSTSGPPDTFPHS